MTEPNGPFDLDARIQDAILDHLGVTHPRNVQEGLDQAAANIKQLLRDTLQAVKPEHKPESPTPWEQNILVAKQRGFNQAIDRLEANITDLLGDK